MKDEQTARLIEFARVQLPVMEGYEFHEPLYANREQGHVTVKFTNVGWEGDRWLRLTYTPGYSNVQHAVLPSYEPSDDAEEWTLNSDRVPTVEDEA